MRNITLLLAFAALAATSCSLQLDSQYGLRWEPKTRTVPNSERGQKSTSAPEIALAEPAAPSWNSHERQASESFETVTQLDYTVEHQDTELVPHPDMDASTADVIELDPQFLEREPASILMGTPSNVQRADPNPAAALGAALLIIAGIFGLLVATIFIIIMGAYGASFGGVLFTLAILALSILFFVIAGNLVKSSK